MTNSSFHKLDKSNQDARLGYTYFPTPPNSQLKHIHISSQRGTKFQIG